MRLRSLVLLVLVLVSGGWDGGQEVPKQATPDPDDTTVPVIVAGPEGGTQIGCSAGAGLGGGTASGPGLCVALGAYILALLATRRQD